MLEPCKTFEFEVRSVCLFDTSQYVNLTFQTRCPTSIKEVEENGLQLTAFPNPYQDILYLEVLLNEPSPLSCKIYNTLGYTLAHKQVNERKKQHLLEWSALNHYPPGVYILEVRSVEKISAIKIQKL
jgi:hypothetical protein